MTVVFDFDVATASELALGGGERFSVRDGGEAIVVHLSDSDTVQASDANVLYVVSGDTVQEADSAIDTAPPDTDTSAAVDAGEQVDATVLGAETSYATESLGVLSGTWVKTASDTVTATEKDRWSGLLSDSDSVSATDAGGAYFNVVDHEVGFATEAYELDVYAYVPPFDFGPGGGLLNEEAPPLSEEAPAAPIRVLKADVTLIITAAVGVRVSVERVRP